MLDSELKTSFSNVWKVIYIVRSKAWMIFKWMRVYFLYFNKTTFLRTWTASAGGLRQSSGRVLKVRALCHVDYKVYIIGIHDTLHLTVYSHSLKAWARPCRLWVRRFVSCHITSSFQNIIVFFFFLSWTFHNSIITRLRM